jgi:hypothetical protein
LSGKECLHCGVTGLTLRDGLAAARPDTGANWTLTGQPAQIVDAAIVVLLRQVVSSADPTAKGAQLAGEISGRKVLEYLLDTEEQEFVCAYVTTNEGDAVGVQRLDDRVTLVLKTLATNKKLRSKASLIDSVRAAWAAAQHSATVDSCGFGAGMDIEARWLNGAGEIDATWSGWYPGVILGKGKAKDCYSVKFADVAEPHEFVAYWAIR